MREQFRVEPGAKSRLSERETSERLGLDKASAERELATLVERLRVLHNRLWAENARSVLLVLQGMDASGKDGTIKRVFSGLNPQGCRVVSFKAPTATESDHDYLWRVHGATPARGEIGIFNRSHYEDVVVARVLGIVDDAQRVRRYRHIRAFERLLGEEGTTVVKVFLHVGKDEQRKRLRERLADPEKRWKFRRDDLETRERWDEYMALYDAAIAATSTRWAPWYVVPADHKWASGLIVATILVETLEALDPQIPPPEPELDNVVID